MTIRSALCGYRQYLYLLLAILVFFMTGCVTLSGDQKGVSVEAEYAKLQKENKELKRALANSDTDRKELKESVSKMHMQTLEKDAQIKKLEQRMSTQQKVLDEAIQEVVRAKAKLRSLESKAEAASNMAEAEIALKTLKVELGAGERDPDVIKAQELLKMSALEFNKENYGGALYLTGQAKSHIKAGQMRMRGFKGISAVEGEVLFAEPLPLRVLTTSNLREAPDLESKVVTTLEKGTPVVGYSYKGEWVRVYTEEGNHGWIFQTLVGVR